MVDSGGIQEGFMDPRGIHARHFRGKKKSRDHVIVSSGCWSRQAGRAEGGGSGTRS